MSDLGTITREYLLDVIKNYGPDHEIYQQGLEGSDLYTRQITQPGSYRIMHGTAGELLRRLDVGEKLYWV